MAYSIQSYSQVKSDLKEIPEPIRSRIGNAINNLGDNPRPAGVVKVSGYSDLYRVRVGNYRIVYFIHDRQLHIVVVAAVVRGKAYEIVRRRLR